MICKHCGTENPDDVLTCYVCGEALKGQVESPKTDTYSSSAYDSSSYDDTSYGENNSRKGFYIIAAIVLALAALIVFVIFNPFSKGANSPRQAVSVFASAFSDGDTKQLEKTIAPYIATDKDEMDLFTSMVKMLKTAGLKYSFDVKEYTKYDQSELESLRREIRTDYGYNTDKIKEAGEVAVSLTMSFNYQGEFSSESADTSFVVVKIGGKWYIHNMGEVY